MKTQPRWEKHKSPARRIFLRLVFISFLTVGFPVTVLHADEMSSTHFTIPKLVENNGSGFRVGSSYQITGDTISPQPVETSTSASFSLTGFPLVTVDSSLPSCGIFINENQPLTAIPEVNLSLICGHSTGCVQMQLSNNGVGWTNPEPYATSSPWTLPTNI